MSHESSLKKPALVSTSSNVLSIIPQVQQDRKETVEYLEALLERAKKGEFLGFIFLGFAEEGRDSQRTIQGAVMLHRAVFALEAMKLDLMLKEKDSCKDAS